MFNTCICFLFFFFKSIFFLLNFFLQQHKNIIKSNNKKNNYINQLLRLPLLKYTHTEKKYICYKKQIKRKAVPSSLPKKKKDPYNTPDGGPHGNSQGIGALNCCRKDLHPRGCRYPRFSSFLCKCNLTKS